MKKLDLKYARSKRLREESNFLLFTLSSFPGMAFIAIGDFR
jgi:hypothetical protein